LKTAHEQDAEFSTVHQMLDSFLTLSLQIKIRSLYLAFGVPFVLGDSYFIFTKLRAGKHLADHSTFLTQLMIMRE
jgi:hypothetical protein